MSNPLVLEFGDVFVKVLSARNNGNTFEVDGMGFAEYDNAFLKSTQLKSASNTAHIIQTILHQSKITESQVRIVVPDTLSYSRIISMPRLNERELISAIKYQADQFIPMSLDDTSIDLEVLYEDPSTKNSLILIVAASKTLISNAQDMAQQCGLIPVSLQTEVSAIHHLCKSLFVKEPAKSNVTTEGYLMFNMGYQSSSLYFFDTTKGTFTNTYTIATGLMLFRKELEVNLNISKKQAIELLQAFGAAQNASYKLDTILAPAIRDLVLQLTASIETMRTQGSVQIKGMYLFNNAINFHALDQLLAAQFGFPCSYLDLSPFFIDSEVLNANKQFLPYFVSTVGGVLE